MFSFAKNERGIRMLSTAIILLPAVCLICSMSRSASAQLSVILPWIIFAAVSFIAFLYERAEEEQ